MSRTRDRGTALIMALALLFVVAATGAALCLRVEETSRSNVAERRDLAARYAAEAGVERARAALAADANWAGETFAFDAFDVAVEVARGDGDCREVRSRASSPAAHATAFAKLRLGSGLPSVASWNDR